MKKIQGLQAPQGATSQVQGVYSLVDMHLFDSWTEKSTCLGFILDIGQ